MSETHTLKYLYPPAMKELSAESHLKMEERRHFWRKTLEEKLESHGDMMEAKWEFRSSGEEHTE